MPSPPPALAIAPFNGLRYDPQRVGSLRAVVTLPYDVISSKAQAQYYRRHRFNFIRVVYGKRYASDDRLHNRYRRARRTLLRWRREGVLKMDPQPSVYPYQQGYCVAGKSCQRWGVIGRVRLDCGRIYRHEEIRPQPMRDRLELLKAVRASLSPLFGLIPDLQGSYRRLIMRACRGRRPVASFDLDGVRHRLWRISDPAWIATLQKCLQSRFLVIADGHHRFEAALAYRKWQRGKSPRVDSQAGYHDAMFYLAAVGGEEPGLLPTHRILSGLDQAEVNRFLRGLGGAQRQVDGVGDPVRLQSRLKQMQRQRRIGIGICARDRWFILSPPHGHRHTLDADWLHQELLPGWMLRKGRMSYTQDLAEGLDRIRRGQAQLVFVLQPPRVKEVLERARSLKRMPGKTTYFYPKPLAGLVEYAFDGPVR